MDTEQPRKVLSTSKDRVPEELIDQLHHANERFHEGRKELDRAVENTEDSHQERVDVAADHLRSAEREAEDVTDRIHEVLKDKK